MKAQMLTKETILDYGVEKRNFPAFRVGDTIEVAQIVKDGEKERVQLFQGDVITIRNNGAASTFTVRKIGANNVGVERILPYHSANISEIKVIKKGKVRRAKLKYLRSRTGRAARIKERVLTKEQKSHMQDQA
ncbi:50S ribosomal protein L19 [Candidatus Dependentiae bacterium]|nr:50S ribosomal protein L19 [Candidatus Dependentiae bacterium]